jgi:hypothetical protein
MREKATIGDGRRGLEVELRRKLHLAPVFGNDASHIVRADNCQPPISVHYLKGELRR